VPAHDRGGQAVAVRYGGDEGRMPAKPFITIVGGTIPARVSG